MSYSQETKQILSQLLTQEEILNLVDSLEPTVAKDRLEKTTVSAIAPDAADLLAKVQAALVEVNGLIPAPEVAPEATPEVAPEVTEPVAEATEVPAEEATETPKEEATE